jgi:hypothetical protein
LAHVYRVRGLRQKVVGHVRQLQYSALARAAVGAGLDLLTKGSDHGAYEHEMNNVKGYCKGAAGAD